MSFFEGLFKKKGSDAGSAAVSMPVQSLEPFEVTCQNFNQFYAMPLPNGRVRPIFPTFSPPNNPGVNYSFVAYGTPEIEGNAFPQPPKEDFQELILNQEMFQHYHQILQYFPCEEAINLETQIKKYSNKYLKGQTSNIHVWQKMSKQYEDIHCVKKSFVYFVFRYIVIPVVNKWKSYTDEESEIDEQYLSALLQLELLNCMNKILLPGKRRVYTHSGLPQFREHKQYAHGMNAYSPQEQQVVDLLQQSLETAIEQLLSLEEQRQQQIEEQRQQLRRKELQEYWKEDIAKYYYANPGAGPYDYLGGSKHKRRQKSKQQRRKQSKRGRQLRRRQKTKKYYK